MSNVALLDIGVDQDPDFIYRGAALALEMGGYNVSCAANLFLCLCRLLHWGTSNGIASISHVKCEKISA